MAEDLDVRATLTAEDQASPKIRKILDNLKDLEKRIKRGMTPIRDEFINPKAVENLRKVNGHFAMMGAGALKAARDMQRSGAMTHKEWQSTLGKLEAAEKKFNASRSAANKKLYGEVYKRALQQANAYKYVWNQAYQENERLERRHNQTLHKLNEEKSRREGRHQSQVDKNIKRRWDIRRRSQEMENRKYAADQRMLQSIRNQSMRQEQRSRDAQESYLKSVRANTFRDEQRQRERSAKMLGMIRNRSMRDDQRRRERDAKDAERKEKKNSDLLRRIRQNTLNREQRDRERAQRQEEAASNRHHRRMMSSLKRAGGNGIALPGKILDRADNPFFSSPFFYAMAGGAAVGAGGKRILEAETDADDAEINARIYGGLSEEQARKLRTEWAMPKAVEMGSTPDAMLTNYTDALKAGVPQRGAVDFANLVTQASEGWEMSREQVSDLMGNFNTNLGGFGDKFDAKRLRSVANAITVLAAEMATTPEKMASFANKGAGASKMLGMSPEAGLAFGAAATSAGVQAGSAGRMLDYMATFINVRWPQMAKQRGSQDFKIANEAFRQMGYGSFNGMDKQRKADPDNFMADFMKRLSGIKNERKKKEIAEFFTGMEWSGELGRLIETPEIMQEAMKVLKQQQDGGVDSLDNLWKLHVLKLSFVFKQVRAAFTNLLGEFGMVLGPMATDFSKALTNWTAKNAPALRSNFQGAMQGLVEGLLGRKGSFKDLLDSVFGGADVENNSDRYFRFFKGFAEGLRSVGEFVMQTLKAIGEISGVDTSTAEGIGYLTAQILGFSVAAHFARPAFSALGMVKDVIIALAGAAVLLKTIMPAIALLTGASAAGTAGGVAVGGAAAASALTLPALLGVAVIGTALAVAIMNWDYLRDLWTGWFGKPGWSDRRQDNKEARKRGESKDPIDNFLSRLFGNAFGSENKNGLEGEESSPSAPNALDSKQGKAMIRGMDDLHGSLTDLNKKIQYASLGGSMTDFSFSGGSQFFPSSSGGGGGGGGGGASSIYTTAPGSALPGGSRRGMIIGGGGKTMLDAIARAEGTAGRGDYDAVLGFGKFGSPSKPLTQMTLNEVDAFSRQMRNHPANRFNSSAVGRYQILGNSTMRDAARALGMDPATTKFDGPTQDRMAEWIAQKQGLGAWEGFKRHPGELAIARGAMSGGSALTGAAAAGGVTGNANAFLRGRTDKSADHINGLNGDFQTRLAAMMQNAPEGIRDELGIYSGYRSNERQAQIFQEAVRKYGSVAAARKWAAPPGKSFHNSGKAADLSWKGRSLKHAPPWVQQWVHQNAASYGMKFPMGHEPWHVEMQETRNGQAFDMSRIPNAKAIAGATPTAESLTSRVPLPTPAPANRFGGTAAGSAMGGMGGGGPVTININGANQSPQEIASAVERRMQERSRFLTHDVEYDT